MVSLSNQTPTIRADGKKLILNYASHADLLTVSLRRDVDPVAFEQVKTDIEIAELDDLREAMVLFSGELTLRVL